MGSSGFSYTNRGLALILHASRPHEPQGKASPLKTLLTQPGDSCPTPSGPSQPERRKSQRIQLPDEAPTAAELLGSGTNAARLGPRSEG